MKKVTTLCTLLAIAALAFAGKVETKKMEALQAPNLSNISTEIPANLDAAIAELEAERLELAATGGDQTEVRLMLEKYRSLRAEQRGETTPLDLACADCAPAHADLGVIGNVVYGYFIAGNLGTDGKWVARFDGVAGTVYHFDLCPSAPGAGTNAGFSPNDVDIRIKDAACLQIAYVDGLSSCVPAWSPNDFQWTCVTAGTYYVEIKDYNSGAANCNGTATMTFDMNYYGAGALPPGPGENCATAYPVAGLPYTDSGTTVGRTNDYDAVCPYTGSTSPDVAYSYTPTADQQVTLSLCLSGYDTKLYVYDGPPVPGGQIACNDDANPCPGSTGSFRSYIECLQLYAGHTYCIIVDGYSGASGDYTLILEECIPEPPCDVVCPEGATPEGEPVCADEYVDIYNSGCNDPSGFPSTTPIACGDVVCGTYGNYLLNGAGQRDTDWYLLTVSEDNDSVMICVTGEGVTQLAILPVQACPPTVLVYNFSSLECEEQCFVGCLPAGDYWVFVSTSVGIPCGAEYVLSVDCQPCAEPFVCDCPDHSNTHCEYAIDETTYPIDEAIPTTSVTIYVPIEYHITDLNVCLDLVHTYDGDLLITLTSPTGTVVDLSLGNGGSGDNYTCTTFDDEASNSVIGGVAPFTGSYIPESPLSAVDFENALGPWVLSITDQFGGDQGWLNWVCLTFEYDVILPVAFGEIGVVAGDEQVTVNWSTESENNVDRFELSRNGNVVANIAAQNSATGAAYSYTDANLTNGTIYTYSLVSVDVNGARQALATIAATPNSGAAVISEYALHQNYPNPFNPTTNLMFDMVEAGHVSISVFNIMGQKVAELVNGNVEAGRHIVSFDATGLSSGLYLYKMEANGFTAQNKMVLMK